MGEIAKLKESTREALTERESEIMEILATGKPVTQTCKALGCGTTMFYDWIREDADRQTRFEEVREIAGHALVDKSFDVLEEAKAEGRELTAAQSAIAKERAGGYRWLAGKISRTYGERIEIDPGENFENLFVEMLKSINRPESRQLDRNATASDRLRAAADAEPIEEADYTIEGEDTEDE